MSKRIAVLGAGGFVGWHLCRRLKELGHWVRGVDIKLPEFMPSLCDVLQQRDLRSPIAAEHALFDVDEVYHLAADMGGIGYISSHLADPALNNTQITCNVIRAAQDYKPKVLYTSSACIYPRFLQDDVADTVNLQECMAWPADPEPGYGLEKLYGEKLFEYAAEDYGIPVRVVRFHNVFGPVGAYQGGREKAPAAACRKIALAKDGGDIEVWGDGQARRSFLYIDDCIEGLIRLMASDYQEPINLGSDRQVSVDELHLMVAKIAGKKINLVHVAGPQGVRNRNSDNTLLREVLGFEPQVSLEDGLARTYSWVSEQLQKR